MPVEVTRPAPRPPVHSVTFTLPSGATVGFTPLLMPEEVLQEFIAVFEAGEKALARDTKFHRRGLAAGPAIQIDVADHDAVVRVWNRDRGIYVGLEPSLLGPGWVGRKDVANLIVSINRALERLQEPEQP